MSAKQTIRLGLAVLGAIASFALSWPYWRDFSYWAESRQLWWAYFAVGFVLAVYVFVIFLRSLSTLFEHDALNRGAETGPQASSATDKGAKP